MTSVVLVIHLILALAIIGLVLLQRSEGGGLGMGSGGMGGLASPQSAANILTRMTGICAGCFFATSLLLAVLAGVGKPKSVLDSLEAPAAVEAAAPAEDEAKKDDKSDKKSDNTKADAPPSVPVAE